MLSCGSSATMAGDIDVHQRDIDTPSRLRKFGGKFDMFMRNLNLQLSTLRKKFEIQNAASAHPHTVITSQNISSSNPIPSPLTEHNEGPQPQLPLVRRQGLQVDQQVLPAAPQGRRAGAGRRGGVQARDTGLDTPAAGLGGAEDDLQGGEFAARPSSNLPNMDFYPSMCHTRPKATYTANTSPETNQIIAWLPRAP